MIDELKGKLWACKHEAKAGKRSYEIYLENCVMTIAEYFSGFTLPESNACDIKILQGELHQHQKDTKMMVEQLRGLIAGLEIDN